MIFFYDSSPLNIIIFCPVSILTSAICYISVVNYPSITANGVP